MIKQNELFYSLDDYFNVVKNKNFPYVVGISAYVEMPKGSLRFFTEEKGCVFQEQDDGSVLFSSWENDNFFTKSIIISTGEEYIREVNDLIQAWFINGVADKEA